MGPFSPTRHARNLDFTKGFQWSHAGFCLRSRGTLIRILCPLTRKACFPNGFWPVPRIRHGFQGGTFSAKPDLLVFPLFLRESWGWILFCQVLLHTVFGRSADHVVWAYIRLSWPI